MEKIAVNSSVHDAQLHGSFNISPRSTLAWKDYWGYDSASPDSTNSSQDDSSFDPPKAPPQERPHSCRSLSLEVSTPVSATISVAGHRCCSVPPTPGIQDRVLEGAGDEDPRGLEASDRWELAWRTQSPQTASLTSLIECQGPQVSQEQEIVRADVGKDSPSTRSGAAEQDDLSKPSQHDRAYFADLLSQELTFLKSCAKRAIDLGKKVQESAAVEVEHLAVEKATAEKTALKFGKLNDDLEYKLFDLRNEKKQLELEIQAMHHELQLLKRERENMLIAIREEKNERVKEETEKDAVLGALLEERLKGATDRESMTNTIRALRKKLESVERDRVAAVKAVQNDREKLCIEREAMLTAMQDLKTRLEFDNDARLSSIRRSSLDVCVANMYFGDRKRNSRKSFSDSKRNNGSNA